MTTHPLVVPRLLATALASLSFQAAHAATITWDGGPSGTGVDTDTAANWVGDTLPTSADEVLFDNSTLTADTYPSFLLNSTTNQAWGRLIWNSAQANVALALTGSGGNRTITLGGAGSDAAAIAAGGVASDLILVGSAFTTGRFTLANTNGTGSSRLIYQLPTTTGDYSINVVNSGAELFISAQIGGMSAANSTLSKTGAGTLTFANGNNNLFSGSATGRKFILKEGTVNFTNNAGYSGNNGNSTLEIQGGSLDNSGGTAVTLNANNPLLLSGDFTFKGTGNALNLGAGAATLSGSGSARTITVSAQTLTLGGAIGGEGYGLTKSGAGTLTLTGASTYDGPTTVNAGTLLLSGGNDRLNTSGELVVNGGTVSLAGVNQTVAQLSGAGGNIQNTVNSTTATLTVTGTSSYSGRLRDNAGSGTARLLALAKTTGGVLRLSGTENSYSGGTVISGGTLLANNASGSATGTGSVSVNSGGLFGGTGSASGAITVNIGGAITPGDGGAGVFTAGSSLTWHSDNTTAGMLFDLGASTEASDGLVVAGAFTKGAGVSFLFSFTDAGYQPSVAYTLVSFGSTDFLASDFAATGVAGTFDIVGNELRFTTAAIPEPSAFAAAAGACALLAVSRRRRTAARL